MEHREVLSVNFGAAFSVGSTYTERGLAVATDSGGDIYVTGLFDSPSVDFDPADTNHTNASAILTTPGQNEAFVARYQADGTFSWVAKLGVGSITPSDIALDAAGDIYLTGDFDGTVDFGAVSLTSQSGDGFLAKLDSAGKVLWANRFGGAYSDRGEGIAVDSAGNAFVTGTTWNDGSGTSLNMLVAEYSASGASAWNEQVGGSSITEGKDVALDGAGHIVVSGYFYGTDDFNPASGKSNVYSLFSGGRSVQPSQASYVLKLDATSGGFVWADAFQAGNWSGSTAARLAVDASNNIVVTGWFSGSVDFNPGKGKLTLPNAGGADAYVVKLNADGSVAWGQSMGGSNNDNEAGWGGGIATDGAGNVYVTGNFGDVAGDTASFGSTTLTDAGNADIFVVQLDAVGNFLSAGGMGGPGTDLPTGLAIDGSGNVFATGLFEQAADFDPGPSVYALTSAGGQDMFVSKLKQTSAQVAVAGAAPLTSMSSASTIAATSSIGAFIAAPTSSPAADDAALAVYDYPLVDDATLAALARGKK